MHASPYLPRWWSPILQDNTYIQILKSNQAIFITIWSLKVFFTVMDGIIYSLFSWFCFIYLSSWKSIHSKLAGYLLESSVQQYTIIRFRCYSLQKKINRARILYSTGEGEIWKGKFVMICLTSEIDSNDLNVLPYWLTQKFMSNKDQKHDFVWDNMPSWINGKARSKLHELKKQNYVNLLRNENILSWLNILGWLYKHKIQSS